MQTLRELVESTLAELKGEDIQTIDLAGKADYADHLIIASGTSDRHLHALADRVYQVAKDNGYPVLGLEGEDSRDWVLVDLASIIVHIMRPETRALYALEKLWSVKHRAD